MNPPASVTTQPQPDPASGAPVSNRLGAHRPLDRVNAEPRTSSRARSVPGPGAVLALAGLARLALSALGRTPQNQLLTLLLLLGAWPGASTAQAATADAVAAWGANGYGQTTVPVAALSGVTAIAAGGYHTVALKTDGSVVAWGDNCCGQTDVPIAAQSEVTAIAAGRIHTVALKNDGSVVAWGDNEYGQTDVPPAAQSGVTAIAAGAYYTVALKAGGTVVAWGAFDQATLPTGLSGVTAIAAGGGHTVALLGGVPLMPSLQVRPSGEGLALSWPVAAAGFTLQATPNLADDHSWTPVLTAPVVEGSRNRVLEPLAGPAKFYRLRQ